MGTSSDGPVPGRVALHPHIVAAICLIVLGTFAWDFASERLYADAGYFLVRVIDEEGFHVINNRWIMVLIQWLPLLGVKMGVGLHWVTVLFSIGNVVLATAAYLFTALVLRDRDHALALLATQFVGLSHALFCPVFEFYYGAMLLIVLRAVLHSKRAQNPWGCALAALLFVLVATCHFLCLLVVLLMFAMDRIWEKRRHMALFTVLLVGSMAHRLLSISSYESGAFHVVLTRLIQDGIGWALLPGRLWPHFVQALAHYPDVLAIAAWSSYTAVRSKDRWTLLVFLAGTLLIYLLISLYYPDGTHDRYRESLDYTAIVWVLIFVIRSLPGTAAWRRWSGAILLLVLALRTVWTVHVGAAFTARTEWIEGRIAVARDLGIRKGLDTAHRRFIPPGFNNAALNTPSPIEYLLLSAMNGRDSTIVLVSFPFTTASPSMMDKVEASLQREGIMLPTRRDGPYFRMPLGPFAILPDQPISSRRGPSHFEADRNGTPPRGEGVLPRHPHGP